MIEVGIQKIGVYPSTLFLSMKTLSRAREKELCELQEVLMVDERSVLPEWEDPVTMAVNAANTILTKDDRERIGLLIVATESGVDQEKPISTWVHRFLDLRPDVRNIEVKHACYGATASVQLAAGWLQSGAARGRSALIINTDLSRMHLGKPWEFVLGAGAVAVLVSMEGEMFRLETNRSGVYSVELPDLMRPTAIVETGNSETSLLSYFEALDACFSDYESKFPEAKSQGYFARNVYHLPFGGMGFRAHKAVLRRNGIFSKEEVWRSFEERTLPSLKYVRRMGGTYGSSVFIALLALLAEDNRLEAQQRVGIFSYGSGCCSELWSGMVGPAAKSIAQSASLPSLLNERRELSLDEYEAIEKRRTQLIDLGNYSTDVVSLGNWYQEKYEGAGLLVFSGVREYYRQYHWS